MLSVSEMETKTRLIQIFKIFTQEEGQCDRIHRLSMIQSVKGKLEVRAEGYIFYFFTKQCHT